VEAAAMKMAAVGMAEVTAQERDPSKKTLAIGNSKTNLKNQGMPNGQ